MSDKKTEYFEKGYNEGLERAKNNIDKHKWNFDRLYNAIFGNFDEYIEGINVGYYDGLKERLVTVANDIKYLSDDEKERLRNSITEQIKKNQKDVPTEYIKQKPENTDTTMKNISLAHQRDLLIDLKKRLMTLYESLAVIEDKYLQKIETLHNAGIAEDIYTDFKDRYWEQTRVKLKKLSTKLIEKDIKQINQIITILENRPR